MYPFSGISSCELPMNVGDWVNTSPPRCALKLPGVSMAVESIAARGTRKFMSANVCSCSEAPETIANCQQRDPNFWAWRPEAVECGAKRRSSTSLMSMLRGRRIAVVGDSIGRKFFNALRRHLSDKCEPSKSAPFATPQEHKCCLAAS